jgi:transposase
VDNYSTHKHEKVKTWLKRNKRVHLHFIPTSSSWLNLVERFLSLLTEKWLRRGIFTSVKELEKAILEFIDNHNDKKTPFVWTKSTGDILEKVGSESRTLLFHDAI